MIFLDITIRCRPPAPFSSINNIFFKYLRGINTLSSYHGPSFSRGWQGGKNWNRHNHFVYEINISRARARTAQKSLSK